MTTSTNLGRVAIVPKGTWNSATAYTKLNVVSYAGSSYMAIQNVPIGTPVNDTDYWQIVAEKGQTGGLGQVAEIFDATKNYSVGDYCIYNDDLYRFTSAHNAGVWNSAHVALISISDELKSKQNILSFDTAPTANSTNPVESGGIKTALDTKQDSLTFDTTPTADSTNPVTSGGVKTALDEKQNSLSFDTTPTANSTNPVTSGGIKTYVDSHDDFKITGTVSSSGYTLTDSRINDEHWEVDWIEFLTPTNVLTGVDWSTDIVNHTVTLSATYSGSTNVVVNMHWVQ